VVSHSNNFMNDIVLDIVLQVAYISNSAGNTDGGLIVYDRAQRTSRSFSDASTRYGNFPFVLQPGGISYSIAGLPSDGIALPSSRDRVYYSALTSTKVHSVDAATLRDMSSSTAQISATVRLEGSKASSSDGMAFDASGHLWYGGLTTSALYEWDRVTTLPNAQVVQQDYSKLTCIDTFAFDNPSGDLIFTTNHLEQWFANPRQTQFDGSAGPSFRAFRLHIGSASYISGQLDNSANGLSAGDQAAIALGAILAVLIIGICVYFALVAPKKSSASCEENVSTATEAADPNLSSI